MPSSLALVLINFTPAKKKIFMTLMILVWSLWIFFRFSQSVAQKILRNTKKERKLSENYDNLFPFFQVEVKSPPSKSGGFSTYKYYSLISIRF